MQALHPLRKLLGTALTWSYAYWKIVEIMPLNFGVEWISQYYDKEMRTYFEGLS